MIEARHVVWLVFSNPPAHPNARSLLLRDGNLLGQERLLDTHTMGLSNSKPRASRASTSRPSTAGAKPEPAAAAATVVTTAGVPVVLGAAVDATTEPTAKSTGTSESEGPQQLDLVFTMDCTGSMGSYIQAAKKNIEAIVEKLVCAEGYDLRFALVAYRDHPPQDQTYVTKLFPFTNDVAQMKANLSTLSAQGGGDGPEAVAAGLKATLDSEWRANATKVCILIADAPPHGLGERGDGFPNGAPDGVDPLEVLEQMSMRGICIYSVGCEPALSNYMHAKAFMVAAAEKTNGQAVSLSSAASLADVIMGGAIEEMDLEQLTNEVVQEVKTSRAAAGAAFGSCMADEEVADVEAKVWEKIQARGYETRHMKTKKLKARSAEYVVKASSLAEARETLRSAAPPMNETAKKKSRMAPTTKRGYGAAPEMRLRAAPAGGCALERCAPPAPPGAPPPPSMPSMLHAMCERRGAMSGSCSDGSDWSDDECEEEGGSKELKGGVKLETRKLSFSQMHRIVGKQRKMGLI